MHIYRHEIRLAYSGAPILDVLDAAQPDREELWLEVQIPVYDSPANCKGWIKEKDTEPDKCIINYWTCMIWVLITQDQHFIILDGSNLTNYSFGRISSNVIISK